MAKHRGFRVVEGKIDLSKPMVSYFYKGIPILRRLSDKRKILQTKGIQEMNTLFSALCYRYSNVVPQEQKDGWRTRFHFWKPSPSQIVKDMSLRWPGGLRRQKQSGHWGSDMCLYIASNILADKSDMKIPRDIAPNTSTSRPLQPVPQEWGYENGEVIIDVDIPEQDSFYKEMVARVTGKFDDGHIRIYDKKNKRMKRVRKYISQHIITKVKLEKWPAKIEIRFDSLEGGHLYNYKRVPLKKLGVGVITFNLDIVGAEGPDIGPLVSKSSDACTIRINEEDKETARKISDKFFGERNKRKRK